MIHFLDINQSFQAGNMEKTANSCIFLAFYFFILKLFRTFAATLRKQHSGKEGFRHDVGILSF